jgi:hypothetical protein
MPMQDQADTETSSTLNPGWLLITLPSLIALMPTWFTVFFISVLIVNSV